MILRAFMDFLSPPQCLGCEAEGRLICLGCQPQLIIQKRPTCWRCNKLTDLGQTCRSCRPSSYISGVVVASHYDGLMKQAITALKYQQGATAAKDLAALLTPLLQAGDGDLIIPVPAAPKRLRQRGYNPAALLARHVSRSIAIPYSGCLVRTNNLDQVGHSRMNRFEQVKSAFVVRNSRGIRGRRIWLIDDVITTGATLNECAKALRKAGATQVWGAALAKH